MAASNTTGPVDTLDEDARLLALYLKAHHESQSDVILELSRVGFGTKRISELLGTTPNTVNVTVQKAKKKK